MRIMRIRPDYLKIDSSLIKYIDIDKNSYEIVKSIIAFSKALNIKTIAEYVHTKEILDLLLEMGVDEFQGFYLGEPSLNIE
ncbi:EAL domain-containing protein [Aliarcobacter butzleri]|uniref:EAL domain-containing protein n=1 Tax=Aliarcobacter butzleri TaxID=28197 RepID=UPI00299F6E2E|nr:EAL domain-containing protein [Aliarcobacter butzleri]